MFRLASIIALTLPATALAGGPLLDITGACPGVLSISASGFAPGGNVAVLTGSGLGSDIIPGGPCAGAASNLSGLRYITTLRADGGGSVNLRPSISAPLCGSHVQFLEASSCVVSNTDTLGDMEGEYVGSYDVHDGPAWADSPETYTCKEACALLYGGAADAYQCSINRDSITGTAWLSEYGSAAYCAGGIALPDDTKVCDTYFESGCQSAYIADNCGGGASINYCFSM